MDQFFEFLGPVAIIGIIAYVIKLILDYGIRRKLIDKGAVDENIKYLFADREICGNLPSVKWGLLLVAVGSALLIGNFLPADRYYDQVTVALMFLFGGIALILYYFIAGIVMKRSEDR